MAAIQGQPVERTYARVMLSTLHQGRREDAGLQRTAVMLQRAVLSRAGHRPYHSLVEAKREGRDMCHRIESHE